MYHLIFVVKIKNNMKVCILGTGLSSLTLAKALVNLKIYVDVVGTKKSNKVNTSRTLGISKSNIDFFNSHIVDIKKLLWKLKKIEIFSDNLKNEKLIKFENKNEYLFSILKNYDLVKILNRGLSLNRYFKKIHDKNSISYHDYNLVINTEYENLITKKYFSKKIKKKYNSTAYTTVIYHQKILNNIATQIFTSKGPLAFLPISDTETSIVYSIDNLKLKKSENIYNLIKKYNFKYKIRRIKKIDKFELSSVILRSYYHENILAFGDLLHRIHPLAGQGFNMTIRDVIILIQIIKNRISLGLQIDKSVNSEFENEMKHKNLIFSNSIDFIYEIFNYERKAKNAYLTKSIQMLANNPTVNKIFRKFADKGTAL